VAISVNSLTTGFEVFPIDPKRHLAPHALSAHQNTIDYRCPLLRIYNIPDSLKDSLELFTSIPAPTIPLISITGMALSSNWC
jgi:hypothetical protein